MSSTDPAAGAQRQDAAAALIAGGYYAIYLGYLFFHQESEFWHWLTLVLLPLAITVVLTRLRQPAGGFRAALSSLGLTRGNLTRGLWWAALLGLGLSALQLSLSRYAEDVAATFASGRWVWLLPLSFVMMMVTAGFTEEFFFRGFVLGRLLPVFRRAWPAVLISAAAFALYHLPYAYLYPSWPSYGDFPKAVLQSFVEAFPVGILIGYVFVWTRRNVLACAVLHALINSLPAMTLIKFGG